MLKTVVLLNIFVETVILFFSSRKIFYEQKVDEQMNKILFNDE